MNKQVTERKEFLDYAAEIAAWVLGGTMFLYLGYRTLDFFTFTIRDGDGIIAYLGLFSTTIGAVIFALIWKRSFYFDRRTQKWRSDEFRKTIAGIMAAVCAIGELVIAVADMTIIADMRTDVLAMTESDLKTIVWATAGLAGLVGISIAIIKMTPPHPLTDPEIDMSDQDADNNGVLDRKQNTPVRPMNANASTANSPDFEKIELLRKVSELERELKSKENPQTGQDEK